MAEVKTKGLESSQTVVKRQFRPTNQTQVDESFEQGFAAKTQPSLNESGSMADQDTAILFSLSGKSASFMRKVLIILPRPVRYSITAVFARLQDFEPEKSYAKDRGTEASKTLGWGWLPMLSLTSALGLIAVAYAFTIGRNGKPGLEIFFILGLLLIFGPSMIRLISPTPSRFERICLLCMDGFYFYLVKVMSSPLYFSLYDEFLHWRTADNIALTGHLFGENSLLPVSPYYPGLEIVTNAVSTLSGLGTFNAALIVIGVGRLVMILSLFMLGEQIMGSARMAGIATIIYMANPHFLFFDAQFAYESLALPLATFVLFAMAPHQTVSVRLNRLEPIAALLVFAKTQHKWLHSELRWMTFTACIVLIAIVFTHHVSDFFLIGLLILWALTYGFMRLTPLYRLHLAGVALLGVVLSVASAIRIGNPVVLYIFSFLGTAVDELGHVVSGASSAHPLFVSYSGQPTPLWERLLTISSVGLILSFLPFGLLCLWKRYRSNSLSCTFGLVALCYPLSQVFRFTNTGSELVDRAAAFLFIPIATMLAIFITQYWPTRKLRWNHSLLITAVLSVIFLGGVILGAGPSSALLPGSYEVIADPRSIEPEGIQAATWAQSYLGPQNRLATDRTNQILMGSYGDQYIVSAGADQVDVSPVFLSLHFGPDEISILKDAQVRYLVVDLRLTQALPLLGFYYSSGEEGAFQYTKPLAAVTLGKFSTVPQVNRVFDSGNIVIYDMGEIINAPQEP